MTALFRRSPVRSTLTLEQRRDLVEVLSAELVDEQRPLTLDDLAAAVVEAERVESMLSSRVQTAQAAIDRLEGQIKALDKSNLPKDRRRARAHELERAQSPYRAEVAVIGAELEQARGAVVIAKKAAKPYYDAIAKARPAHVAEVRRLAELRAVEAAQAAQELEQAAWTAERLDEARNRLKRLPEVVLAAIAAERRRAAVEAMK